MLVPMVIEHEGHGERAYDIWSLLLKKRIIFIGPPIDDSVANLVVAQLLYLSAEDARSDIELYINSPGGSVTAGMAIYDTMQHIAPDVMTQCVGLAASMGAVLLAGGAAGKRHALPNAKLLIHQPWGGFQGQASDIQIHAEDILKTRAKLNGILALHTGKPLEDIENDTDRDFIMTAEEGAEYGLIDAIREPLSADDEDAKE